MRIRFQKGKQREFLKLVLEKVNAPSLRELINRGIGVNYSTLKNYFNEERNLPESLFDELIGLGGFDRGEFSFEVFEDSWGQVIGGEKSRKN